MKSCVPCGRPVPPQPPLSCGGSYLMQRILAAGKALRRPAVIPLCPQQIPRDARAPFTVLEAHVYGEPHWQEAPCCRRGAMTLLVRVPLALRLRDACGACFLVHADAEEELILTRRCPEGDLWRGQIFVQAAARPWRGYPAFRGDSCDVPVELLIEGFLLSPCAMGCPDRPACPDGRPLYPQARFDPWQD